LVPFPDQSAIFVGLASASQDTDFVRFCLLRPRRLDFSFDPEMEPGNRNALEKSADKKNRGAAPQLPDR